MIKFDSEADLETFVFENIRKFTGTITAGSGLVSAHRQLNLPCYGCADIVTMELSGFDEDTMIVSVIELKNAAITKANLAQLCRYMDYFNKMADESNVCFDVYGFLVGPKTFHKSDSDDVFLMQSVENVSVIEFGLCPDEGFKLTEVSGWCRNGFDDADHSDVLDLLYMPPKEERDASDPID